MSKTPKYVLARKGKKRAPYMIFVGLDTSGKLLTLATKLKHGETCYREGARGVVWARDYQEAFAQWKVETDSWDEE